MKDMVGTDAWRYSQVPLAFPLSSCRWYPLWVTSANSTASSELKHILRKPLLSSYVLSFMLNACRRAWGPVFAWSGSGLRHCEQRMISRAISWVGNVHIPWQIGQTLMSEARVHIQRFTRCIEWQEDGSTHVFCVLCSLRPFSVNCSMEAHIVTKDRNMDDIVNFIYLEVKSFMLILWFMMWM